MRDDIPPPSTDSSPWDILPGPGLDADALVGTYAIEPTPLDTGRHFRTIRIESARTMSGTLILNARTIEIDDNGTITKQSDRVRLLGETPKSFVKNPLTAKKRCDAAEAAMSGYLAQSGRARTEFDVRLERILTVGIG